jgi:hypothetical protein
MAVAIRMNRMLPQCRASMMLRKKQKHVESMTSQIQLIPVIKMTAITVPLFVFAIAVRDIPL